jgi:hypothetical protein
LIRIDDWIPQIQATTLLTMRTVKRTSIAWYGPTSGLMDVYRDDELAVTWTDDTPITSGAVVMLQTGHSKVAARFHKAPAQQHGQH